MSLIICPECGREISEYANACFGCGCPMETIKRLRNSYTTQGLSRLFYGIYGTEQEINLPAKYLPVEYDSVLNVMLDNLSPRERSFIEMRFGLKDNPVCTLEEIAGKLDVTYYRSTQIEQNVKRKVTIRGLGPLLLVMSEYPTIQALEREAQFRNYLHCEQGNPEPYQKNEVYGLGAFDKLCYLLLKMYKPFPVGGKAKALSVSEADFTVRTYMYLHRAGIHTIDDLVSLSEDECKRKVTQKADVIAEIKRKLEQFNLKFAQQT